MTCEYACCDNPADRLLDGYRICKQHVHEHIVLMAEDRARALDFVAPQEAVA